MTRVDLLEKVLSGWFAIVGEFRGWNASRMGHLDRKTGLGKLKRFDFLGRTYVSVREVRNRYREELKAGRPKRPIVERAVASVKAALKTDAAQAKLGGYAGAYEKAKRKGKAK
jgi:hypothetical protein